MCPVSALDPVRPANHYTIDQWGPDAGFPEETIFNIVQSHSGYLWASTPAGAVRFDGRRFILYDRDPKLSVPIVRTESILAALDGGLWVQNAEGRLWRVVGDRFTEIQGDEKRQLGPVRWIALDTLSRLWIVTGNVLHRIVNGVIEWDVLQIGRWNITSARFFLEPSGRLWILPREGGMIRLSPEGRFERKFGVDDGLSSPVLSMTGDAAHGFWLSTEDGVAFLHNDRVQPRIVPLSGLVRVRVDRNGATWFSSPGGLSRYYRGKLDKLFPEERLSSSSVQAMFFDREGSLWLGTYRNGLYRIKDSNFANVGAAEGLSSDHVNTAYRDRQQQLWVGTNRGVDRIHPNGFIDHFTASHGLPRDGVRVLAEAKDGRIWAGSESGLFVQRVGTGTNPVWARDNSSDFKDSEIRALAPAVGGEMWVATTKGLFALGAGGVRSHPVPDTLDLSRLRILQDSPRYGLLVAMFSGGLWNCRNGRCSPLLAQEGKERFAAYALLEERGDLWVACSRGLVKLRLLPSGRVEPQWYPLTKFLPTPETEFYQMAQDSQGRLWLAGRRSLVRMDKVEPDRLSSADVRQFDLNDGMRSANFGIARQSYRAATLGGRMWFPSMRGLVSLDPDQIRDNPLPPPVHIERFVVNGRETTWQANLRLAAGVERIELTFGALSLVEPAKVRYRYKLEGFDPTWIDSGNSNLAVYTRLGSGQYRFKVLGCNNDGVWNEQGDGFAFEILPHFYEQGWFLAVIAAALMAAVFGVHRIRTRGLTERTAQLEDRVRHRTAELERAREQAEQAARVKADFLATMSHEIRTPMNGVLGMVSLLEGMNLTEEQRACTETISGSGKALLAILNDVLELSRIEAGKLELTCAPVNLRELCGQVTGLFQQAAKSKALHLAWSWPAGIPEWFAADGARLRQVLVNLVGNAVKFTERGAVELTILGYPEQPGRWQIQFAVRDTGIGMSKEQLGRLFQKFMQADSSSARKYGGTGLGLAISQRLAERMGGGIEATSELGAGSEFRFIVPLAAAEPAIEQRKVPVVADRLSRKCRILLAEDNPINVKVATGMLARLGYAVKVAANGRQALTAIEREQFDLIFMDCQMPELDGFEATRAIRSQCGSSAPIIVAMTANAMEGDRERCLAAGMNDYIAKPVVLQDLAACINRWAPAANQEGSVPPAALSSSRK
jgi:signal transduction histidine kinase/CheY-like chemotaxis protein/ligand-binding sensor domain-containing protein